MPHLDELEFVLVGAQRFHNAVNAVAGEAEHVLHTPVDQGFNQDIRSGHFDSLLSARTALLAQAARAEAAWKFAVVRVN
jgi:hypothetical protein